MNHRVRKAGFTLIELLVVIGIIGILAGLIMPSLGRSMRQAKRIQCANNLRQIGIAFQQFADLNQNRYPMQVPNFQIPTDLGLDEVNFLMLNAQPFREVASELVLPRLLICAADTGREPAESFGTLTVEHISYRVATNAAPGNAAAVVATDRNVVGASVEKGQSELRGKIEFNRDIHELRGNVLMADGRVEWVGGVAWQTAPVTRREPAGPTTTSSTGVPPEDGGALSGAGNGRPTAQTNQATVKQTARGALVPESKKGSPASTNALDATVAVVTPPVPPITIALLSPDSVGAPSDGTNWWWLLLLLLAALAYFIWRSRRRRDPSMGRMAEFYTGAAINADAMLAILEENEIAARWEYVHAKQREHEDENTRPMRIFIDENEVERANELFSGDQAA